MILFLLILCCMLVFFFFKQKTAYEMRISDWSSDVCSSDLLLGVGQLAHQQVIDAMAADDHAAGVHLAKVVAADIEAAPHRRLVAVEFPHQPQIGRASCRERVCQYV